MDTMMWRGWWGRFHDAEGQVRYIAKKTTSNLRIGRNLSVSGMKISIPGH